MRQRPFNSRSTVHLEILPGQLQLRVSSYSVVTQNSFKLLALIQVINRNSESPLLFRTLKIKLNNLCDTLQLWLYNCIEIKFGHAESSLTCKLFSFCSTPWLYASPLWKIRINYLCIKAAFMYNRLFQRGAYMPWFRCRNGISNKCWTAPSTVSVRRNYIAHTILSLKCRKREKLEESSIKTPPDLRFTPECSSCPATHLLLVHIGFKPNYKKLVTFFPKNKRPLMTSEVTSFALKLVRYCIVLHT